MNTSFHEHKKLNKWAWEWISRSTQETEDDNEEEKYGRLEVNDIEEWAERIAKRNKQCNLKRK